MYRYFYLFVIALRYSFLAGLALFIFGLIFGNGAACLIFGVLASVVGFLLMIPIGIMLIIFEKHLWKLPYSNQAVLAFLSFVISLPGVLLLVAVQMEFGINGRETMLILFAGFAAGYFTVRLSGSALLDRREQVIKSLS